MAPSTAPVPAYPEKPAGVCDRCKQRPWYHYSSGWKCRQCNLAVADAISRQNERARREREQAQRDAAGRARSTRPAPARELRPAEVEMRQLFGRG